MKSLANRIALSILAVAGSFLLVSGVHAYYNPNVIANTIGGGGGTVGSLDQVVNVGNTSTLPIYVTSASTSTFAGPVSTTRLVVNSGTASQLAVSFSESQNSGFYEVANNVQFYQSGSLRFEIGAAGVSSYWNSTVSPVSPSGYDLGEHTFPWKDLILSGRVGTAADPVGAVNASTTAGGTTDAISASGTVKIAGSTIKMVQSAGPAIQLCSTEACPSNGYGGISLSPGTPGVIIGGFSAGTDVYFQSQAANRLILSSNKLGPIVDLAVDLGAAALRYATLYASTGTVTSIVASTTAGSLIPAITATGTVKFGIPQNGTGFILQDSISNNARLAFTNDSASWDIAVTNNGNMTLSANGGVGLRITSGDVVDCYTVGSVCQFGSAVVPWKQMYVSSTAGQVFPAVSVSGTVAVSSTGAISRVFATTGTVFMAGLGAPSITDDLLCIQAGSSQLTHQITTCTVSSAYFKDHIASLSDTEMLAEVKKLRAVSYVMKATGKDEEGFIAEEIAGVDPSLVVWTDGSGIPAEQFADRLAFEKANYPSTIIVKDGKTMIPQSVDYARFSVIEAAALQAEDARITALENRVGVIEKITNWAKSLFKKH